MFCMYQISQSVGQLIDEGFDIKFKESACLIMRDGEIIARGTRCDKLFKLTFCGETNICEDIAKKSLDFPQSMVSMPKEEMTSLLSQSKSQDGKIHGI